MKVYDHTFNFPSPPNNRLISNNKPKAILKSNTQISNQIIMPNRYFSRKGNKYNARKTKYNGRYYHSGLEAKYAESLDWRKKAGEIKEIIPQYKISIDVNDVHIANYYMDFKVVLPDGRIEMHEVKGAETDLWRMKWRLSKALNPDWVFVLVK
jgi:hypothetical protein